MVLGHTKEQKAGRWPAFRIYILYIEMVFAKSIVKAQHIVVNISQKKFRYLMLLNEKKKSGSIFAGSFHVGDAEVGSTSPNPLQGFEPYSQNVLPV